MNREPANKSMGLCAIFKEAYKLTALNKKIFGQISLTTLFPLAIFYLSDIQISHFIHTEAYPEKQTSRRIAYGITQSIYLILLIFFTLWSSSSVMYTIACFYTSRDITYKKVIGVFGKLWGRLVVTFFWCFLFVAFYTFAVMCFTYWFLIILDDPQGEVGTTIVRCLSILYDTGLIYLMVVINVATVVTVLEKDYGRQALAKSMRLISDKIWLSGAVFGLLLIPIYGILLTFWYLVVSGDQMNLVGKVFVGIGCYLLMPIWIHFSLVVHTVIYFLCKSYHNEDISTVANHLDASVIHLGRENVVQLERVPI